MTRRSALLVAESGGHLEQLTWLEPRLRPTFDRVVYATSESDQSRSLLRGRDVFFGRPVPPRALLSAAMAGREAHRLIRQHDFTDVISTGSAVAVPYLLAARRHGLGAHYIESAARSHGPSLSGRILQHVPGVRLYSQYSSWSDPSWRFVGSVLDGFAVEPSPLPRAKARRIVVTLGTLNQYPFTRAVEAIRAILPEIAAPDCELFWQIGNVPPAGLPGKVRSTVPAAELRAAIDEADLVFAHAGTGSCLQILASGRSPVLLPRSAAHGEHVDDHQELIAEELTLRGLAIRTTPAALTAEHAFLAMNRQVRQAETTRAFPLDGQDPDAYGPVRRPGRAAGLANPDRITSRRSRSLGDLVKSHQVDGGSR